MGMGNGGPLLDTILTVAGPVIKKIYIIHLKFRPTMLDLMNVLFSCQRDSNPCFCDIAGPMPAPCPVSWTTLPPKLHKI